MNINDLKHGNPTFKDRKVLDKQVLIDTLGEFFIKNGNPPLNNSEKTKSELIRIKDLQSPIKGVVKKEEINKNKLYKEIDKDVLKPYLDFIKEKKLKINSHDLIELKQKVVPFIASLKQYYNRPRPNSLAFYFKLPVYPEQSVSMCSSSYPSSHTFVGLMVSGYIINKFPKHKSEIIEIQKQIMESREVLGLSYYSDIQFSMKVFKNIDAQIGLEEFLNHLK